MKVLASDLDVGIDTSSRSQAFKEAIDCKVPVLVILGVVGSEIDEKDVLLGHDACAITDNCGWLRMAGTVL